MEVYSLNQAIEELARALHQQRGTEVWARVTEATRNRWRKRATSLLQSCPSIQHALTTTYRRGA